MNGIIGGKGIECVLMHKTYTYARGVHALREACKRDPKQIHPVLIKNDGTWIYRPLTFEENIVARVEDYNTLNNPDGSKRGIEDRLRLFNSSLDSCTGIAYKKGTTLFKIITESEDLIKIHKDFDARYFLSMDYSSLQGIELDNSQGLYNNRLSKRQVLNHPAWNAVIQDKSLLRDYIRLVFSLSIGNNMDFSIRRVGRSAGPEDELEVLYIHNLYEYSCADGVNFLFNFGHFVRLTKKTH